METFKDYVWRNLRNKGYIWETGYKVLHLSRRRLENPSCLKITDLWTISAELDIPDNEMEKKIIEIYRHGDLENRY